MHQRGRSEPAVAENKKRKRRHHLSLDGDRRILQAGLVRLAKEQVGIVDGVAFDDVTPTTLQTEKGLEFLNRGVQTLFNTFIRRFSVHNKETKASVVERFSRTLNTRMWRYLMYHETWRYIDVFHDVMGSYNDNPYYSISMDPPQVSAANQEEVWQRQRYTALFSSSLGYLLRNTSLKSQGN